MNVKLDYFKSIRLMKKSLSSWKCDKKSTCNLAAFLAIWKIDRVFSKWSKLPIRDPKSRVPTNYARNEAFSKTNRFGDFEMLNFENSKLEILNFDAKKNQSTRKSWFSNLSCNFYSHLADSRSWCIWDGTFFDLRSKNSLMKITIFLKCDKKSTFNLAAFLTFEK